MNQFEFYDAKDRPVEAVVRVSDGIKSKDELFTLLANALRFPAYFGHNWDALGECLADLSWIDAPKIILLHEDLPLLEINDINTYLDILDSAMRTGCKSVRVMFPLDVRYWIERNHHPHRTK